jgi:hypothetical protein
MAVSLADGSPELGRLAGIRAHEYRGFEPHPQSGRASVLSSMASFCLDFETQFVGPTRGLRGLIVAAQLGD